MASIRHLRRAPPPLGMDEDGIQADVRQLCERLERLIDPRYLAVLRSLEASGCPGCPRGAPAGPH